MNSTVVLQKNKIDPLCTTLYTFSNSTRDRHCFQGRCGSTSTTRRNPQIEEDPSCVKNGNAIIYNFRGIIYFAKKYAPSDSNRSQYPLASSVFCSSL